jgi:hypothetical protein
MATDQQQLNNTILRGIKGAAGAVTTHEGSFIHSNIAHSNRTALNAVSGNNTGDQDLSGYLNKTSPDGLKTLALDNVGVTGVGPVNLRSSNSATTFQQIVIDTTVAGLTSVDAVNGNASLAVGIGQFNAQCDAYGTFASVAGFSFSGGGSFLYLDAVTGFYASDETSSNTITLTAAGMDVTAPYLQVSGQFGCNGSTPQGKATVRAAATDLATALTLVNQLRTALINNGICV